MLLYCGQAMKGAGSGFEKATPAASVASKANDRHGGAWQWMGW
jgi:hypothetical protein